MHEHSALPTQPVEEHFKLHRRFDRAARLLGETALERLGKAHVAVFGLGGVGSFAVEGLVRSGVGEVTLVDFDLVCVTNTNRQLHAVHGSIGKPKATLMAERAIAINPLVRANPMREFYRDETAETLLPANRYDFVIDAIDNMKAKLHLLSRCLELKVPVVSTMGAAGRLDPTLVRVCDLCETHSDPFAKDVRKLLRLKHGIDTASPTGIAAVFSLEPRREPEPISYDHEGFQCVCPQGDNEFHTCERRHQIDGTVPFVTSMFGMTAASVVVRTLSARATRPG
jgi:tRNA A37 threonylcarbamoyladenosine dehydratase